MSVPGDSTAAFAAATTAGAASIDRSVVVANAGSGKTYLLANRLIRWLIQERRRSGRAAPDRILATTFTRKAAGEILERLLRHLALGALDAGARARFADPAQVGPATAQEYEAVLVEIVRSLHRLSIGTIDGHFVRLAGVLGAELGLPEGWRIAREDEGRAVLAAAVGAVIAADPARAERIARQVGDGRPETRVQAGLERKLGVPLELWLRCRLGADPNAAWSALLAPGVELVPGARRLDAAARAQAIAVLREAPPAQTKDGRPVKHWVNAIAKIAALAEQEEFDELLDETMVKAFVAREKYASHPVDGPVGNALEPLVQHARAELQERVRQRLRGTHELVALVDAAATRVRAQRGAYGFADITQAVAGSALLDAGALALLRRRLDRSIQDLALDEFQDTSPAQFAAFRELIDEVLGSGDRRFLAVGDPKQSIYGWRGGTPALLASLRERPQMQPDAPLATSYRTRPAILEFVNEVLEGVASRLATGGHDPSHAGTAELLRAAGLAAPDEVDAGTASRALARWTFVPHASAPELAALPAVVQAFRAPATEQERRGDVAAMAAEVVAARVAADPRASIAVLVRSNDEVSRAVAALRERGIAASDEGRSPLLDSPAVAVVLALLRVADHPDDRISHYLATREPARSLLGLEALEAAGGGDAARRACDALSLRVRSELHELGLAAWVEAQARALLPACSARDRLRLQQLVALAASAPEEALDRPESFARLVESQGSRLGSGDAVRVMTVHTSKGLEFDEVVFASMDDRMGEVTANNRAWCALAPDPTRPPIAVAPVLAQPLRAHAPLLDALAREAEVLQLQDDFSVCYVAFTRARRALHLICETPTKASETDPPLSPARLLELAFPGFAEARRAPGMVGAIWTHGDLAALDRELAAARAGDAGGASGAATAAAPAGDRGRNVTVERVTRPGAGRVRAPSLHGASASGAAAPGATASSSHTMLPPWSPRGGAGEDGARGTLAHAWFAAMEWPTAAAMAAVDEPALLRGVALEIHRPVDPALAQEVRAMVATALAVPAIAGAIGPKAGESWGAATLEVRREMPFVAVVDGGMVRGRMDRVVLGVHDGRVVRAQVLDWKTGAVGLAGDALQERIAPYREQLQSYRAALCAIFGLPAEAVGATIVLVDRGEVVAVE
ncbi:MAG: UvrD-helicase domain-containing protein [Phycisphaerales bacterium]